MHGNKQKINEFQRNRLGANIFLTKDKGFGFQVTINYGDMTRKIHGEPNGI